MLIEQTSKDAQVLLAAPKLRFMPTVVPGICISSLGVFEAPQLIRRVPDSRRNL